MTTTISGENSLTTEQTEEEKVGLESDSESESEFEEESESSDDEEFWMCVYARRGKMPFAVSCLEKYKEIVSTELFTDIPPVAHMVTSLAPRIVVTNCGKGTDLLEALSETLVEVKTLGGGYFKKDTCRKVLRKVQLRGSDSTLLRLCGVHSRVDFESVETVASLGALLQYVAKNKVMEAVVLSDIVEVPYFSPKIACVVDGRCAQSLSIFHGGEHPSVAGKHRREGHSWFSIFSEHCFTSAGKRLLKDWLRLPLCDAEAINERSALIQEVVDNQSLRSLLATCCKQCAKLKISAVLQMLAFSAADDWFSDWKAWSQLRVALKAALLLAQASHWLPQLAGDHSAVAKLLKHVDAALDLSASKAQRRLQFRAGYSRRLDACQKWFDCLDQSVAAHCESQKAVGAIPNEAQIQVTHKQTVGFVLSVPRRVDDAYRLERHGLERSFDTDTHAYFKYDSLRKLDKRYGEAQCGRLQLLQDLGQELAEAFVRPNAAALAHYCEAIGPCDALQSAAFACELFDLSRAKVSPMAASSHLKVVGGRHVPLALRIEHSVANDAELGNGQLLVCGANRSGKSVFLKMLGAVQYLAQCGMFVAAQSASLTVCRHILTRVDTSDVASHSSLSSFTRDCCQLNYILRRANSQSLCLIDEFGTGTRLRDGVALLAAVVADWNSRASAKPMALIATHFLDIFASAFPKKVPCVHMAMAQDSNGRALYLYKAKPGAIDNSFGLLCAKRVGIPLAAVRRAAEVRGHLLKAEGLPRLKPVPSEALTHKATALKQGTKQLLALLKLDESVQENMDKIKEFLQNW